MPYTFPQVDDCYFCWYFAGVEPYEPIEAGELTVVFTNIRQRSRGATLVAPRRHVTGLSGLEPAEVDDLAAAIHRAVRAVGSALQPDAMHVWCGHGVIAGQSEPHLHFQVMPRYEGAPYSFAGAMDLPVSPRQDRLDVARAISAAMP